MRETQKGIANAPRLSGVLLRMFVACIYNGRFTRVYVSLCVYVRVRACVIMAASVFVVMST